MRGLRAWALAQVFAAVLEAPGPLELRTELPQGRFSELQHTAVAVAADGQVLALDGEGQGHTASASGIPIHVVPGFHGQADPDAGCRSCTEGEDKQAKHGAAGPDGLCLAGFYHAEAEGFPVECYECPKGFYTGSAGLRACGKCGAGTFGSLTGQAACSACAPGRYQAHLAMESCDPCPAPKINAGTGVAECYDCPTGMFQDEEGQTACKVCTGVLGTVTEPFVNWAPGQDGVDCCDTTHPTTCRGR